MLVTECTVSRSWSRNKLKESYLGNRVRPYYLVGMYSVAYGVLYSRYPYSVLYMDPAPEKATNATLESAHALQVKG